MDKPYGLELIADFHDCDPTKFTRESITEFFKGLCDLIEMKPEDLHFWDDQDTPEDEKETEPHLVGTSAVQFIRTSNITIHTLDILKRIYLNVFSCKNFEPLKIVEYAENFFSGRLVHESTVTRT